jgi:outer membrane receptor for ferrienterochelin and colicins
MTDDRPGSRDRGRRRRGFLRWVVLLALVAPAWAGTDPPRRSPDLLALSLEDLMGVEIDSVYGASRHTQKLSDAPSAVTVITADDIRAYGYRTLADLLRSVRSFYITNDRNYDYIGVRGFGRPGDYDTRLLLMVDGLRVNDNIYDTAQSGFGSVLDIDLIDRVEIIRGPSSSLYGTNAFFGAINIITKLADKLPALEVGAVAGSRESYTGRARAAHTWSNGAGLVLAGSIYDSQGANLYFPAFDDPSTHAGIAVAMDGERAEHYFAAFARPGLRVTGARVRREKGIPTAAWGTIFNDAGTRTTETLTYVALEHTRDLAGGGVLQARSIYNAYVYDGDYAFDWSEGSSPDRVVNRDTAHGNWLDGEVLLTVPAPARNRVTTGTEFRLNTRVEQRNWDREIYLDDSRRTHQWALYVQDEWTARDHLIVNAGLRYDQYQVHVRTFSPRLALICAPAATTTLKAIYGGAFRAPNAYELYYNDGEMTQKASPHLKPEGIRQLEFVVEQDLGELIHVSVAGYAYRINRLISLGVDPDDELMVFANADRIEARGAEFEVSGRGPIGAVWRTSYTVQRAEDSSTDERLSNSPAHMVKLNCMLPLPRSGLTAGIETQYLSERLTETGTHVDACWIANTTLLYRELLPRLDLSAGVYNLFDEQYADPASTEHTMDAITQDGRSVRAGITYRIGR